MNTKLNSVRLEPHLGAPVFIVACVAAVLISLIATPPPTHAADGHRHENGEQHDEATLPLSSAAVNRLPNSKNQIITLGDNGPTPAVLTMKLSDSIVFFLNSSKNSLLTLKVDFGEHRTHCASSNLRIDNAGLVTSIRPFSPNDFSSMCFHDRGTYPFTIFGLPKQPAGVTGRIVVE